MRRITTIIIGLALVFALGACAAEKGYEVRPVVDADDRREVDVPDLEDVKGWEKQDCFEVTLWYEEGGFLQDFDERTVGIACMVDGEEPTNSEEPKQ